MRRIGLLSSIAVPSVLLFFAQPARADFPQKTSWILATAKATGAGGEQFISSLRINNLFNTPANVTLTYLAQSPIDSTSTAGGDNTAAQKVNLVVGAGHTLAIEDVIGTYFAGAAAPFGISAGGIRVDSDIPVGAVSRTYVANARSATGLPGTYGFSIPAQAGAQRIFPGDTAVISYISASPNRTSGFRSNFIMLNLAATTTVVNVSLVRADGSLIGQRNYTLVNLAAAQQGDIAASFGYPGPDTNLSLYVTVPTGGPVIIGTSIIDNAISSLNYAAPDKVAGFPRNGAFGTIFQNDNRSYGGRFEIFGGTPTYWATDINLDTCSSASNQFFVGAIGQGYTGANTTFTANSDGTFSFSGGDSSGDSWSGTVVGSITGTLSGTLTFVRTAAPCNGVSKTFNWLSGGPITSVSN